MAKNASGQVAADTSSAVSDWMAEEARIVKGVRLSAGGDLTAEQRANVIDVVKAHLAEYQISQKEAANAISRASSVVSQVLSGSYDKGDSDSVLRALNSWLDADARRRERGKPIGFYSTAVFKTIRNAAKIAQSNAPTRTGKARSVLDCDLPHMTLCYGPAGIGKSIGGEAVAAEDPTAIYVRVQPGYCGDIGLARLLAESMGLSTKGQYSVMVQSALRNSSRLLIIDEAHTLVFSGLEFLRALHDVAGVPILLLSTVEIYERLSRQRTYTGMLRYNQLASRIARKYDLLRGIDGQGGTKRPIFSLEEVRAIFKDDQVRLTSGALELLRDCCCLPTSGMLRLAASVFVAARRVALKRNGLIDEQMIRELVADTVLPAGESAESTEFQLRNLETQQQKNRKMAASA